MLEKMVRKKASTTIHIIVGIILIAAGVLFLINKSAFGVVLAAIGLLIEAIRNWI